MLVKLSTAVLVVYVISLVSFYMFASNAAEEKIFAVMMRHILVHTAEMLSVLILHVKLSIE